MLSHEDLILHVEVADIVVEIDILADEEGSYDRVLNTCRKGQPRRFSRRGLLEHAHSNFW